MGMTEGLAHQVEIQIVRPGTELGEELGKLLRGQSPGRTLGAGAEGAAEIAEVGDLQIDLTETFHSGVLQFFDRSSITQLGGFSNGQKGRCAG